jgi:hypothetical protein
MKITLYQAFGLLDKCSAISTVDGELFYPTTYELTGEDGNEFAYFEWEDNSGLVYQVSFYEGKNRLVEINENVITLVDDYGEEVQFFLLGPLKYDNIEEVNDTIHNYTAPWIGALEEQFNLTDDVLDKVEEMMIGFALDCLHDSTLKDLLTEHAIKLENENEN